MSLLGLLHAVTGGRLGARSLPAEPPEILPGWASLLAELELTADAFHEVLKARSLRPHFRYQAFTRPKKGGGRRQIHEPDARLKRVQREILDGLLALEEVHPAAVAFQREKSIADHVWVHAGAEVLVTADVTDFFPRTDAARVEEWWRGRVDCRAASLLTLLTTYCGSLPQGAPTSPALSNCVNREMDEQLTRRAAAAGARFTRYCDDMLFSWRRGQGPPSDFESAVRATLNEFGYALHPSKGWRVYRRRDEPEVTGLIIGSDGRVRLREAMRRVMRELARSTDPHDARRLSGYLAFESMVVERPRDSSGTGVPPIPPVGHPRRANG